MKFNYIILSLFIISPLLIQSSNAYLSIPPTKAFSMINGSGGNVTANSYADFVELVAGTGITIAFDHILHEIMINSTGSSSIASIHQIGNVTETGCAVGQYLAVNSTGFFVCTTLSGTGETNTASSSGGGQSIVLPKVGVDLPFKGIACTGTASCSNNSTDVIITGTGDGVGVNSLNFTTSSDFDFNFNTNASSLSLDGTVFNFRLGNNIVQTNNSAQTVTKSLTLNSLILGGAANANSNAINSLGTPVLSTDAQRVDRLVLGSSLVTSPCIDAQYLSYQNSNTTWVCTTNSVYENNTMSSPTHANSLVLTKAGVDLPIKGIACGGNISCSTNSTDITLTYNTPATSGFTNIVALNSGTAKLVNSNQSNTVEIKSLTQGTGITITNGSTVTIASSIKTNTKSCTGTDKFSAYSNTTGDFTCSTDSSGSTARENLVALWGLDKTWTNIGVAFVDVYLTANSNGEGIRIDTNGMTTVTLDIMWTVSGAGNNKCQIVDIASGTNILITNTNLANGQNINATQAIPTALLNTIKTYKPQCLSTTSTDDPTWLSGQVLLRP